MLRAFFIHSRYAGAVILSRFCEESLAGELGNSFDDKVKVRNVSYSVGWCENFQQRRNSLILSFLGAFRFTLEMPSSQMISRNDEKRLETARNMWLASVRQDGTPHLVPIWFVWLDDKVYLCTSAESVKARNITLQPRIAFALEDGDDPVVIEGEARIMENVPSSVVAAFQEKFEWDIRGDGAYNAVIEITPTRVVL